MAQLTVTSRGQVTFRKDVLRHLGIRPGDKIRLDLLPGGRVALEAEQAEGSWAELRGILDGKTNGAVLTIDQINDAIADAYIDAGMAHLRDD